MMHHTKPEKCDAPGNPQSAMRFLMTMKFPLSPASYHHNAISRSVRSAVIYLMTGAMFSFIYCATAHSQVYTLAIAARHLVDAENQKDGKYQDAVQLIFRNASTFESKNFDAYMDTLSADCEGRELTADIVKTMNGLDLDLKVDIVSFEILPGGTDTMVKIECLQTTRKVGGQQRFVDNEMQSIHTVIKTKDGWKIGKSKILNIQMLYDK